MPCTQPTAGEGPAVVVPHPLGHRLAPNGLARTADGDVTPRVLPPKAPVGPDGAAVEPVGGLQWRPCVRPLPRRGGLACGRGWPGERCLRAGDVTRLAAAVTRVLGGPAGVR
jgi:hypothetical protein